MRIGRPWKPDSECRGTYRKTMGGPAHRLIVELRTGIKLKPSNIVHHCNPDDRLTNDGPFVVCQDNAYHLLLETRTRALKECGNANWKKCRKCLKWDNPGNMQSKQIGESAFVKYWHYRWKGQCVNKGDRCETRRHAPRPAPLYRGGTLSKRQQRVGGVGASQLERERSAAWQAFQASDAPIVKGNWKDQCRCGSMEGKRFRTGHHHWCPRCGRQKGAGFPHIADECIRLPEASRG